MPKRAAAATTVASGFRAPAVRVGGRGRRKAPERRRRWQGAAVFRGGAAGGWRGAADGEVMHGTGRRRGLHVAHVRMRVVGVVLRLMGVLVGLVMVVMVRRLWIGVALVVVLLLLLLLRGPCR